MINKPWLTSIKWKPGEGAWFVHPPASSAWNEYVSITNSPRFILSRCSETVWNENAEVNSKKNSRSCIEISRIRKDRRNWSLNFCRNRKIREFEGSQTQDKIPWSCRKNAGIRNESKTFDLFWFPGFFSENLVMILTRFGFTNFLVWVHEFSSLVKLVC